LKVSHGIKQIESITWNTKNVVEDITWYKTFCRYHMVLSILRVSHGIANFECITWYILV